MPVICCYIILIIAHISSILSMLSNLFPVFTYKDTTLKSICQDEYPIKIVLNIFIKVLPSSLIFCVENRHQPYEHHSLSV